MQITSIKSYSIKSHNYKVQSNQPSFRAGYIGDIFIKGDLPIDKLKKFTIAEYKQLSKSEIASINEMIDNIIQNESWKGNKEGSFSNYNHYLFTDYNDKWRNFHKYLKEHDIVAARLKDKLEEEYGAGNYKIVSIGRSVSSICKCLGYKIGEENVIQLPMTNARRFRKPYDLSKIEQSSIDALTNYLASMGMSKEDVQSSGKKYIFTDYRNLGGTMAGAERLFKSDRMYGNNDNIQFHDILELLYYFFPKEFTFDYLNARFGFMEFKDLSVVNRCDNLLKTSESVEKPEDWDLLLKSFYFKFMDNEIKSL